MSARSLRSLRAKILLYAGVPVLALLIVVIVLLSTSSYHDLYEASLFRIASETISASEQIDNWNLETVTVPRVMAAAQESGMFGARESSLAYAREILESYPQFTGAYFGYEPNAEKAGFGGQRRKPMAVLFRRFRAQKKIPAQAELGRDTLF